MELKGKFILILGLIMIVLSGCTVDRIHLTESVNVSITNDESIDVNISNNVIDVSIQDYTGEIQSYFLTYILKETTLTSNAMINGNQINVVDTTGCNMGNAVNIYDDRSFYQGLIISLTATSINLTPPLDKSFMQANSFVECGDTNMAYDGLTTPRVYSIHPPTNVSWDITSSVISILDNTIMDSAKFGGIPALSNGFLIRTVDGTTKNLLLAYNNNGFKLRGFEVDYIDRAPSGVYGLNAFIDVKRAYGAVFRIDGRLNDTMETLIQDDLTGLTRMVMTINGHTTDE